MEEMKNPHASAAGAQSVAGHNAELSTAANQEKPQAISIVDAVIEVQGQLSRAGAIVDLAVRDIDDDSSGCNALGVVEQLIATAIDHLEQIEIALNKARGEARHG